MGCDMFLREVWRNGAGFLPLLVVLIGFSVCSTLLSELAHRGSLRRLMAWLRGHGNMLLANILLALALECLLAVATGSLYWTALLGFVCLYVPACISFFKYAARNEPLYASDFRLFLAVFTVSDGSNAAWRKANVIPAVVMGAFFLFTIPSGEASLSPVLRVVCLCAAAVLFFAVLLAFLDLKRPDNSYMQSGFAMGLLFNILYHYSRKAADHKALPAVDGAEENARNEAAQGGEAMRPDVVLVLSESFWDAAKLEGITFSEDPIPFFRKLSAGAVSGNLLVTPFGGGTCNVESEVLLGVVNRHFNVTDSFYHTFIKKPVPSLATAFRDRGYHTTALHTFNREFYMRDKALENMGFDEFRAEDEITEPRQSGRYLDDSHLTDMIVETLDNADAPAFVFGISMENHQPYTAKKFKEQTITVEGLGEDDVALRGAAEAYAHGLRDADRELERLVTYCQNRERPTVVLFFGDHLGALGADFALYRRCGLVAGEMGALGVEDVLNVYTPPFVLWSNYKEEAGKLDPIGANFLGAVLLEYIGMPKPAQFQYLETLWKHARCMSREDCFLDAEGKATRRMTPDMRRLDAEYKAVSYRTMGM